MAPAGSADAGLQRLLEEGAETELFSHARAEVWQRGRPLFSGGVGPAETVFDLASLTKVMATTALFVRLWHEGQVQPETPVARFFPEAPIPQATLADLLAHRSGLPAFRPFFADALRGAPALLDANAPRSLREAARAAVVEAASRTLPTYGPGTQAVYSDVGFILLGEALAAAGGGALATLFEARVAKPLGLGAGFRPLSVPVPAGPGSLAPTGLTRPRPPAPGQAHVWADLPTRTDRPGEVDDDNAWMMDGVSGHAGLFGTATDVARFGQSVLEELGGAGRLAPATLWERLVTRDTATPGSTRALGFDTPSAQGSSAGKSLGQVPPGGFGHLGYTGTSLWVDRSREVVVALCTNRTWKGREDTRIQAFRPRFHDAVVERLGL